jgi:hypothetical protein
MTASARTVKGVYDALEKWVPSPWTREQIIRDLGAVPGNASYCETIRLLAQEHQRRHQAARPGTPL